MNQTQRKNPVISTEGWTYQSVLEHGDNFRPIERIKATSSGAEIQQAIKRYDEDGIPMIIEGWHEHEMWPKEVFTLEFFQKHSDDTINVRNVHDLKDSTLLLKDFIEQCRKAPPFVADDEDVRMYGKDAECPSEWKGWLEEAGVLPVSLLWDGPQDYFRYRPKKAPVETLMCYLGVGDTFTAAHKDLCASSGHNLMCYTENDGASYWFMTKGSDAPDVGHYFQRLGQELDHETHIISLDELKNAPFDVHVGKQVLGDLVLVPPRSCHQVVNFGGITLKTSWSRMSLKGLSTAFYHELPIYQRVCRFEIYRVKNTIFCSLQKQTTELETITRRLKLATSSGGHSSKDLERNTKAEQSDKVHSLAALYQVFNDLLIDEYSPNWKKMEQLSDGVDAGSAVKHVMCDFCGCDIFQSFFECPKCIPGEAASDDREKYAICAPCYVDGRSCQCLIMEKKQIFSFDFLLKVQREAAKALKHSGYSPILFNPQPDHKSVFVAACLLRDQRERAGNICNIDGLREHGLNCNSCHNAKCFAHLLTRYKLHSSDGLLSQHFDNRTHSNYHKLHQAHKGTYVDLVPQVNACQRLGTAPEASLAPYLRVHLALHHNVCRPVFFSLSSPGFYDDKIQDCDEEVVEGCTAQSVEQDDRADVETASMMSTLTPCPSSIAPLPLQLETEDVEMIVGEVPHGIKAPNDNGLGLILDGPPVPEPSKVHRALSQILDYVAVPQARHLPSLGSVSMLKSQVDMKTVDANSFLVAKGRKVKLPVKTSLKEARNSGPLNSSSLSRIAMTRKTTVNTDASNQASKSQRMIHGDVETPNHRGFSPHSDMTGKQIEHAVISSVHASGQDAKRKRKETLTSEGAFPSYLAAALNFAAVMEDEEDEAEQSSSRAPVGGSRQQTRKAVTMSARAGQSDALSTRKKRKVESTKPPPPGLPFESARGYQRNTVRPAARESSVSLDSEQYVAPQQQLEQQPMQLPRNNMGTISTSGSPGSAPSSASKYRFKTGLEVTFEQDCTSTAVTTNNPPKPASSSTSVDTGKRTAPGELALALNRANSKNVSLHTKQGKHTDRGKSNANHETSTAPEDLASALNHANSQNTSTRRIEGKRSGDKVTGVGADVGNMTQDRMITPTQRSVDGRLGSGEVLNMTVASSQAAGSITHTDGTGGGTTPIALSFHITMQQNPQQHSPVTPPHNQQRNVPSQGNLGVPFAQPSGRWQPQQTSINRNRDPDGTTRRYSEGNHRRWPPKHRNIYDRPSPPKVTPPSPDRDRRYQQPAGQWGHMARKNSFEYSPAPAQVFQSNITRSRVPFPVGDERHGDLPLNQLGDERAQPGPHQRWNSSHHDPNHRQFNEPTAQVTLADRLTDPIPGPPQAPQREEGRIFTRPYPTGKSKIIYEREEAPARPQPQHIQHGIFGRPQLTIPRQSAAASVIPHPDARQQQWTERPESRIETPVRTQPTGSRHGTSSTPHRLEEDRQPHRPAILESAPARPMLQFQASAQAPPRPPSPPAPSAAHFPLTAHPGRFPSIDPQAWEDEYEMNEESGMRNLGIGPPPSRSSTRPRSVVPDSRSMPSISRYSSPRARQDPTRPAYIFEENPWQM